MTEHACFVVQPTQLVGDARPAARRAAPLLAGKVAILLAKSPLSTNQ